MGIDENQHATLQDPLHVLSEPIARENAKRIKIAIKGLIHDIWLKQASKIPSKMMPSMKFRSKEDKTLINVIQAHVRVI